MDNYLDLDPETAQYIREEIVAKSYRMPQLFIAFSARRNSGKSTASKILQTESGIKAISLGDSLRRSYSKKSGVPLEDLYDASKRDQHRPGLIAHASLERGLDNDVYVKGLCESLNSTEALSCDDIRQKNEVQAAQLLKARFIRIQASWDVRAELGCIPDAAIDNHVTETYMAAIPDSFFDAVVVNQGEGFYNKFKADILDAIAKITGERRSFR